MDNNNQKQKQRQDDVDPTSNENEVTEHEETATSSTAPPPKDVLHSDVCSICMDDVSMLDIDKGKELLKAAAFGNITAISNLKRLDKLEGVKTPSFTPIPTCCTYCGKAHNPPTTKLNACKGCRSAYYCCKEHQILDWKLKENGHKEECGQLKELNQQYQTK